MFGRQRFKDISYLGEALGETLMAEMAARSDSGLTKTAGGMNARYKWIYAEGLASQFLAAQKRIGGLRHRPETGWWESFEWRDRDTPSDVAKIQTVDGNEMVGAHFEMA